MAVVTIRFKLLKALKEEGLKQKEYAKLVGDHPSIVSRIVNGIWNPDERRKIKYAKALGRKPEEIF